MVAFYILAGLDLMGILNEKLSQVDRDAWRDWIWDQQISAFPHRHIFHKANFESNILAGAYGTAFRPSPIVDLGPNMATVCAPAFGRRRDLIDLWIRITIFHP